MKPTSAMDPADCFLWQASAVSAKHPRQNDLWLLQSGSCAVPAVLARRAVLVLDMTYLENKLDRLSEVVAARQRVEGRWVALLEPIPTNTRVRSGANLNFTYSRVRMLHDNGSIQCRRSQIALTGVSRCNGAFACPRMFNTYTRKPIFCTDSAKVMTS